jgi:hypothetical protein
VDGQRKALIVASGQYEQEALRDLMAPAADAEALRRVLGDPQIGDFAVQVVRNEPAHVIQAQIEELFSASRGDDVLLLHFSGHGLKSESGELFFAAANTRPDRLGSTAVSADFVQRCMRASRSRSVVLLLDCCYGGAFAQGVSVRAAGNVNVMDSFPRQQSVGRGRAVITASSAMEYAFEGDQLAGTQRGRPSVFTSALVEGLATGEADRDEDGWVSLDELYDYVFDKVREQNPHQTQGRQFELEGELYLARSQRRSIQAASVPAAWQTALTGPDMHARLGAVGELRAQLAGDSLPAAAGAYQALAELARSDTGYVAGPAVAALREAAVHPSARDLHFGRVEQGSAPPRRTVRLLGPPIARACVARPSHDWIRVDQSAERLDIAIDTGSPGTLLGSVSLQGPTGEAVIAIDVDVVSPAPQAAPASDWTRPAGRPAPAPAIMAGWPEAPVPAQPRDQARLVIPASQPSARRGAAAAGLGVALLAGAAGLISLAYAYDPPPVSGSFLLFERAVYLVPMAVTVTALLRRKHAPVMLGLLQGLWWPSVSWLAWDIDAVPAYHSLSWAGRHLAGYNIAAISDVLGVIAALLLLVSWQPAADRRSPRRIRALPAAIVCSVVLSQIAGFFLYRSPVYQGSAYYIQGAVAVAVGLAVSWYAVSLRSRALGGVLLLGWATTTAIFLISSVLYVFFVGGGALGAGPAVPIEWILLATTVSLTVIYLRGPSEPDRGRHYR